tara:strand:- start:1148 stop:2722 length:1575 start_codon:yes stop_codon:yes gene_type:complete
LSILTKKLNFLQAEEGLQALASIGRGIEREALRIDEQGHLSLELHSEHLGSALTHPWITTDFSEALLEFVTPVASSIDDTIHQLTDLHVFTMKQVTQESLWPSSMPCFIENTLQVPIAQYGTSFTGQLKTLYREGLKHRYGSMMQMISGVHFNFSVSSHLWKLLHQYDQSQLSVEEYQNQGYFDLMRNFQRIAWVLPYLFGASPALCHSFLTTQKSDLPFKLLGQGTYYLPYATSLRMSDLGYTTSEQDELDVSYNSLDDYLVTFKKAIQKKSARFSKIGLFDEQGHRKQLNDRVLQIENEYYMSIRPKRVTHAHEKPSHALKRGGVEYVEVRLLDVNPFSMIGIEPSQLRMMDLLLLTALLNPSAELSPAQTKQCLENLNRVVLQGRDPQLTLYKDGQEVTLKSWLSAIFDQCGEVAHCLDSFHGHSDYTEALAIWRDAVDDPSLTLSGQIMDQLQASQVDHVHWAKALAIQHKTMLLDSKYEYWTEEQLVATAQQSITAQIQKEMIEQGDFEKFLQDYFAHI